jgi:hypothetical protein
MSKSNLPINYQEQLLKEAQEISKRIAAPSGDRIKIDSHGFTLPDGTQGEEMHVVIVDFVSANMYYDRPYNKDNPSPPACFAIGREPSLLIPSENSPQKQAESCTGCPMNQFNTALVGKGKACKNTRLLAVLPLKAVTEAQEDAPLYIMQIPPTSLKVFDRYVATIASRFKRPPIGIATKVTPNTTLDYAAPIFESVAVLEDAEIAFAMERRADATARLIAEPDVTDYEPPPKRGR